MSGVYGAFLECFPELMETFMVWSKEDKSDAHKIRAVYIPDAGDGIKRRKYTSGNTGLDITESDYIYIQHKYATQISIGNYIQRNGFPLMRLTGVVKYDRAAGYQVYTVERITGATFEDTEKLPVKEATFA